MNIGKEISVFRRRVGLTQIELSNRAKISQSNLSKIESGKSQPKYGLINLLMDISKKTNKPFALVVRK